MPNISFSFLRFCPRKVLHFVGRSTGWEDARELLNNLPPSFKTTLSDTNGLILDWENPDFDFHCRTRSFLPRLDADSVKKNPKKKSLDSEPINFFFLFFWTFRIVLGLYIARRPLRPDVAKHLFAEDLLVSKKVDMWNVHLLFCWNFSVNLPPRN